MTMLKEHGLPEGMDEHVTLAKNGRKGRTWAAEIKPLSAEVSNTLIENIDKKVIAIWDQMLHCVGVSGVSPVKPGAPQPLPASSAPAPPVTTPSKRPLLPASSSPPAPRLPVRAPPGPPQRPSSCPRWGRRFPPSLSLPSHFPGSLSSQLLLPQGQQRPRGKKQRKQRKRQRKCLLL